MAATTPSVACLTIVPWAIKTNPSVHNSWWKDMVCFWYLLFNFIACLGHIFSLIFSASLTSKLVCFVREGCDKGKPKFINEKSFNAADLLLPIDLIPMTEGVLIWKALLSANIGVEKNSLLFAHSSFEHKKYSFVPRP